MTEYLRGGDLFFHLEQRGVFTEDHTRFYAAEITLGVQHLHQLGIIHRTISVGIINPRSKGYCSCLVCVCVCVCV